MKPGAPTQHKKKQNNILFKEGAKLEAKDHWDNRWWAAKILEVDVACGEVLVHFIGWNVRHDEWIKMDSPRLQPASRKTRRSSNGSASGGGSDLGKQFKQGEEVMAVWNKIRYPATILRFEPDGRYMIEYYDGVRKKVRAQYIRRVSTEDLPFIQGCKQELLSSGVAAAQEGGHASRLNGIESPTPGGAGTSGDPSSNAGDQQAARRRKSKFNIKEIFNIQDKTTSASSSNSSRLDKPLTTTAAVSNDLKLDCDTSRSGSSSNNSSISPDSGGDCSLVTDNSPLSGAGDHSHANTNPSAAETIASDCKDDGIVGGVSLSEWSSGQSATDEAIKEESLEEESSLQVPKLQPDSNCDIKTIEEDGEKDYKAPSLSQSVETSVIRNPNRQPDTIERNVPLPSRRKTSRQARLSSSSETSLTSTSSSTTPAVSAVNNTSSSGDCTADGSDESIPSEKENRPAASSAVSGVGSIGGSGDSSIVTGKRSRKRKRFADEDNTLTDVLGSARKRRATPTPTACNNSSSSIVNHASSAATTTPIVHSKPTAVVGDSSNSKSTSIAKSKSNRVQKGGRGSSTTPVSVSSPIRQRKKLDTSHSTIGSATEKNKTAGVDQAAHSVANSSNPKSTSSHTSSRTSTTPQLSGESEQPASSSISSSSSSSTFNNASVSPGDKAVLCQISLDDEAMSGQVVNDDPAVSCQSNHSIINNKCDSSSNSASSSSSSSSNSCSKQPSHQHQTMSSFPYLKFDFNLPADQLASNLLPGVNMPAPGRPITMRAARLPAGWRKRAYVRTRGLTMGKWDVFVESPEGRSFRSKMDLSRHFEAHGLEYSIEDFDFVLDPPLKRIRNLWKELTKRGASNSSNSHGATLPYELMGVIGEGVLGQLPTSESVTTNGDGDSHVKTSKLRVEKMEDNHVKNSTVDSLPGVSSITPTPLAATSTASLPGHSPPTIATTKSPSKSPSSPGSGHGIDERRGVRCNLNNCNKLFRNEKLLLQHVKHYHQHLTGILEEFVGNSPTVTDLAYLRTRVGHNHKDFETDGALLDILKKVERKYERMQGMQGSNARTRSSKGPPTTLSTAGEQSSPNHTPSSAMTTVNNKSHSSHIAATTAASGWNGVTATTNSVASGVEANAGCGVKKRKASTPLDKADKRNKIGDSSLQASPATGGSSSVSSNHTQSNTSSQPLSATSASTEGPATVGQVLPATPLTTETTRRGKARMKRTSIHEALQQTETSSTATSTAPAANSTTTSATTTSGAAGGRVGVGGTVSGDTNAPTPAKPTWKRRPTRATDEASTSKPSGAGDDKGSHSPSTLAAGSLSAVSAAPSTSAAQTTLGGSSAGVETMSEEEVVHCVCGRGDGDGLMIQCDVCLTWQHGICLSIHTEQQVPDKYICATCTQPRLGRKSALYTLPFHWQQGGLLPILSPPSSPSSPPPSTSQAAPTPSVVSAKSVDESEEDDRRLTCLSQLMSELSWLVVVLHSLRVKLQVAEQPRSHPKVFMWSSAWEEKEEQHQQDEQEDEEEIEEIDDPPPNRQWYEGVEGGVTDTDFDTIFPPETTALIGGHAQNHQEDLVDAFRSNTAAQSQPLSAVHGKDKTEHASDSRPRARTVTFSDETLAEPSSSSASTQSAAVPAKSILRETTTSTTPSIDSSCQSSTMGEKAQHLSSSSSQLVNGADDMAQNELWSKSSDTNEPPLNNMPPLSSVEPTAVVENATSNDTTAGEVAEEDFVKNDDFSLDFLPWLNEVKELLPGVLKDISGGSLDITNAATNSAASSSNNDDISAPDTAIPSGRNCAVGVTASPRRRSAKKTNKISGHHPPPVTLIPQPKLINREESRLNLVSHIEHMQTQVDQRLSLVEQYLQHEEQAVLGLNDTGTPAPVLPRLDCSEVKQGLSKLVRDLRSIKRVTNQML